MKTFKELCDGKPSNAVRAMIDGLIKGAKRPDFVIDMETFGRSEGAVCFGCAATCAIQELTGHELRANSKIYFTGAIGSRIKYQRPEILALTEPSEVVRVIDDLDKFEEAIDSFRCGAVSGLFIYFDIHLSDVEFDLLQTTWELYNTNWVKELPKIHAWNQQLIDLGL